MRLFELEGQLQFRTRKGENRVCACSRPPKLLSVSLPFEIDVCMLPNLRRPSLVAVHTLEMSLEFQHEQFQQPLLKGLYVGGAECIGFGTFVHAHCTLTLFPFFQLLKCLAVIKTWSKVCACVCVSKSVRACMRACCMRACVRVCVLACVLAYMRGCGRARVCECVLV